MLFKPLAIIALLLTMVGCAGRQALQARARQVTLSASTMPSLATPRIVPEVEALCIPPAGWQAQPLKTSDRHTHQVWISPSGNTAYGVIRFSLPLPVGPDLALGGFLREMRDTEGDAVLLSRQSDPELPGVRFVAEGGQYVIRTNLLTRGWRGWAIYAGTFRDKPVMPDELKLAEAAREHTVPGVKAPRQKPDEPSHMLRAQVDPEQ